MKKLLGSLMIIILILTTHTQAYAYSYGDPGEEAIAKAYVSLVSHLENDNWEQASIIINTYEKDFRLYFEKVSPYIEQAVQEKDKELLLSSYQVALRLNIERRLFFAEQDFEDYGRAKLLLAKARGTFDVLSSIVAEKEGEEKVEDIYHAFDYSLEALGNPGLFGIGSKESDFDQFQQQTQYIVKQLKPLFVIGDEDEDGREFFEEEPFLTEDYGGNSTFWLWFSIALIVVFAIIVLVKRKR